ncbi:hypothetical protein BgiBS90_015123 [Biomphalaria glabrata]|nr:hypothetical protein BgiBS90_015123 [Biomphalaria glabrata]
MLRTRSKGAPVLRTRSKGEPVLRTRSKGGPVLRTRSKGAPMLRTPSKGAPTGVLLCFPVDVIEAESVTLVIHYLRSIS